MGAHIVPGAGGLSAALPHASLRRPPAGDRIHHSHELMCSRTAQSQYPVSFKPMSPAGASTESLGSCEREVVAHLAQGIFSEEIPRLPGPTARTVEMHLDRLLRKPGVRSTAPPLTLLV